MVIIVLVVLGAAIGAGWLVYQRTWRYRVSHAVPLERGRILFKMGRYDEAIRSFEQVVEMDPHEATALRGLARCYKARGELAVAAGWANEAVKYDRSPMGHVLAGEIDCQRAGHWRRMSPRREELSDDQITFLRSGLGHALAALEMNRGHSPAYRLAAEAHARLGDTDKALELIRRGAEVEPESLTTRLHAVDHLLAAGQSREALEHALYAADRIPGSDPGALRRVAQAYWALEDYDKAIEYLTRLTEEPRERTWALAQLAKCYHRKEEYATALRYANKAMEPFDASPGRARRSSVVPELQYVRGAVYYQLEEYDKAIVDFTRAAATARVGHVHYLLGMAYLRAGRPELARPSLLTAIELDPAHVEARREVAGLLANDGEVDQALWHFREMVRVTKGSERAFRVFIDFCRARGLEAEAEAELRRLLSKRPDAADVAAELAGICVDSGRGDEAALYARIALAARPEDPACLLLAARAEAARGSYDRAAAGFARVVARAPQSREVYLTWADANREAGRLADARDVYQRAIMALPSDGVVRNAYGRFLIQTGRHVEGIRQLKAILDRKVDTNVPLVYEPIVEHYLRAGDMQRAREEIGVAIRSVPMNVRLQSLLMRVLRAEGNWRALTGGLSQIATELDRKAFITYQRVAAHVKQRNYDAAREVAEEALTLFPEHRFTIEFDLGIAEFLSGEAVKGIERVSALLARDETDANAGMALSLMKMVRAGEVTRVPACKEEVLPAVAIDGWIQLAELHESDAKKATSIATSLLKATVYANAGWHEVAAAECEAILREYPTCIFARRLLPVLWARAGRRDKAIATCRKLLADGGPPVGLGEALGDLLLLEGKSEEALKAYGAAAEAKGATPDAMIKHALIAYAAGAPDVAAKSYKALVDSDVQDVVAKQNLAWILAASDADLQKARSFAEIAYEVYRDNPAIVDTLGWIQYRLGDYPLAIDLLDRAVELAPHKALYHFHLGMARWRAGRTKEAIRSLEKAVGLDPDGAFVEQAQQTLAACGS